MIMTKGILVQTVILLVGFGWLAISHNWNLGKVLNSIQNLIPGMFIKSALAAITIYFVQQISWRAKS
jgi:biotin transporter BioY